MYRIASTRSAVGTLSDGSGEGREHRRYPIQMEVAYRLSGGRSPLEGVGQTIQLSSRDVFFRSDRVLPVWSGIELRINWPVRLDEALLSFIVHGVVVHSDETGTGVEIHKHEFRTRRAMVAGV
jgi:hypothetical protein